MKNICVNKTSYLSIFFISLILFTCSAIADTSKTDNWLDDPINIRFQNETLSKVLKQISEQTGVSIAYDQELANEKVTGNYQNVRTSDAITRLFRSKNISIQVNEVKKIIIVKTFGAKNFIWAGIGQGQNNSSPMTMGELEKMHAQQYKEYKDRIADNNEVLDSGMTRGELQAMHKKQYKEYQTSIANEHELLEGGDMTRGELRAKHKQQYKTYQEQVTNNDNVLFFEGGSITRGELRGIHKRQYKEYQKQIADDSRILEGGMNRRELREMHEKQYKSYKNSNSVTVD